MIRCIQFNIGFLLSLLLYLGNVYAQPLSNAQQIKAIGWVHATHTSCSGYFGEPNLWLAPSSTTPLKPGQIHITGHGDLLFSRHDTSILKHVSISEPGRRISADKATLIRDPKTGKIDRILLRGHIRIRTPGKLLYGQQGHYRLATKTGVLQGTLYHVSLQKNAPAPTQASPIKLTGLVAWGQATQIIQATPTLYLLRNASYSTCQPVQTSWHVSARRLRLNRDSGRGQAWQAWLYWHQTPLAYLPYLAFPIDKRRQSGLLTPQYSYRSHGGLALALPFYLNLRPDLDLTLTPKMITKRGILWTGQLRYLTDHIHGELAAGSLFHDRYFAHWQSSIATQYPSSTARDRQRIRQFSAHRRFLFWQQQLTLSPQLSLDFAYNYVSDDYFLQDFELKPLFFKRNSQSNRNTTQLPRNIQLRYQFTGGAFDVLLQTYQNLRPINQSVPYALFSRLPQLDFNWQHTLTTSGLQLHLQTQMVRFKNNNPAGQVEPYSGRPFVDAGRRFLIQPSMSLPLSLLQATVTPTVSVQLRQYQLTTTQAAWPQHHLQTAIPIVSLLSQWHWSHYLSWFGQPIKRTISPFLHYLYVPWRAQSDIPIFDSTRAPLNFSQLMRNNRFTGFDRLGDANQLAYGLTSQWQLADNLLQLGVGQIHYFTARRVTLCATSHCGLTEDPRMQDKTSPWFGQLKYQLNHHWQLGADVAWDQKRHAVASSSVFSTLQLDPRHVLYYRYQLDKNRSLVSALNRLVARQNSMNFGLNWGIGSAFNVITIFNWRHASGYATTKDLYYGLQYNAPCWATRLLAGRQFNHWNQDLQPHYDRVYFLQFVLKGLGNIGDSKVDQLLQANIPGYQDVFTPMA